MSLFKARDLWCAQCGDNETFDQASIFTANLGSRYDKIIVGSHSGYLRVFEPSVELLEDGTINGNKPTDLVIEMHLPQPVLQISAGKLVSGSQNEHLSVLHPRSVAVYSLVTKAGAAEHGDQSRLVLAYEHQLRRSAFCMVLGPFGGVNGRDFLCVQSLDGTLSFFEQETFSFIRFLPGFLLPGPLVFLPHTDSFLTVTSNWHAETYRYQVLAEAGGTSDEESASGRKVTTEWSYNIGEAALDVVAVTWANSYCDILVLGERNLFCLKDNGTLKFMKRLEYKPCCFHPYFIEPDGRLMVLIVSETNTLLVYEHTKLLWSAQLFVAPVAVTRATFEVINSSQQKLSMKGVLVLLSDQGELQCSYLGTEPSLFMAPPLEIHAIDYEQAGKELSELQKVIKTYTKRSTASLTSTAAEQEVKVSVSVNSQLEPCPFPHSIDEEGVEIPMCRVSVELVPHSPLSKVQVSVIVQPPLTVSQVSHTISSLCERSSIIAYVYMEQSCDIPTLDVRVITSYMASTGGFPRVLHNVAQLPLKLVALFTAPAKEADFKVTLNTNQPVVSLSQLFPEFVGEGVLSGTSNAAGFQYYGGRGSTVTVLAAKSSQRYRLQCDTLPSLCLLTSQLVQRLNRHFSRHEGFTCSYSSSLPLHELFSEIGTHFFFREKARKIQEELGQRTTQFRVIQRRLLAKFKDKTPTPLTNLDMLLKEAYQQILASTDEMEEIQQALLRSRCQLGCVTRLILLMMRLMNTVSEEDYSDLQAALPSTVYDAEEQGWEEVTDAALSHLLRTSLAKGSKTSQHLAQIALEPMKDITRFKKHISAVLDRISKGSNKAERKDNVGELLKPVKSVSPIPEAGEGGHDEEPVVPVGSQYGERAVSANPRGRSAALLKAHRAAQMPVTNDVKPSAWSALCFGLTNCV
ncbi:protein PTHB1 isoform X3 [Cryptotermes secundus]|uniref:protein PTHB1 isoform X3 n=1 Tax=Cryptotermes secundus TaxID=105785 RepID=UPI000CD7C489|nr:protein PTHB1 isoform X3 [Cryptotermes secundus]